MIFRRFDIVVIISLSIYFLVLNVLKFRTHNPYYRRPENDNLSANEINPGNQWRVHSS